MFVFFVKVWYDRIVFKKDGVEENYGEINVMCWYSGFFEFEFVVGWL